MKLCRRVAAGTLLLALAGCGRSAPEIKINTGPSVTVEVPNGGSLVLGLGVDFAGTVNGQKLELKGGRLFIGGKGYGAVQGGDRVKVDGSGKVAVNGQERPPTDG
jgi:hypothetical protein